MNLPPRTKLAAARLWAVNKAPYFSSALLFLVPREVPLGTLSKHGTMGVSANAVLAYEVPCLERWTVAQIGAVLLHEVGHLIRGHAKRCASAAADPAKWNRAADAEINDDLVAIPGLVLPDSPILPSSFSMANGLTAEEYYRGMPEEPEKPEGDDDGGHEHHSHGPGSGSCGGCAGNPGKDEETEGGRTEAEVAATTAQVARDVQKAVESKGRGSVPEGLARWANEALLPPRISWRAKLARISRRSIATRPGSVEYRYSRPSRRQSGVGFGAGKPVIAGMVMPVPDIAIALDTSGSMTAKDILVAVSEARAILTSAGARVTFVSCDAAVHEIKEVRTIDDIGKLIKGGGGTDFVPVFDALRKLRNRPEVVVFVTDGQGPAPHEQPRGCTVIWLLVGSCKTRPLSNTTGDAITWGEFIEVDD